MMKLNILNLYTTEQHEDCLFSVDFKKGSTLNKVLLTSLLALAFNIKIPSADAGVILPAPIEQSIDCNWSGNYVNCTINEPQGIGSVLIYREVDGEPWFSLLEYPDCPKTKSFEAHADGPSSLLIDVTPCSNTVKISPYRYIPMDPKSPTGQMKVLKVPLEYSLDQSIEGLVEENKRLRKFMRVEKKERGVVREN